MRMPTPRIKLLFYAEVVINTISAVMVFAFGGAFLRSFNLDPALPLVSESLGWFGALLVVITVIMARALLSDNEQALRFVIEGYLIGDVVYLIVLARWLSAAGAGWSIGAAFAVGLTLVLIVGRIVYLARPAA
ncbi:MAG: hypothetical protein GYB64_19835 [Chloroflexi bacterium]|nr:hypothetical protein [Chloroflexota bacterium]